MRCVQLPAAAAIGVLLSEEGFGHIRFSPNYPVGNPSRTQMGVSRLFSEAFGGEGSTKTFTRYKLPSYYRAYKSRFYSSNVTPSSRYTSQPAALRSRIAAGTLVSWLPRRDNLSSDVSCPISAGKLVS